MAFTSILLTGVFILSTLVWLFTKWSDQKSRLEFLKRNVQFIPQPNAFWQAVRKQRSEKPRHEVIQKHGKVFGFNFLNKYTICVAEPEIAQLVLSKEFTNFTNRRTFEVNDFFFKNMSTANDEHWKRLRAVVTPTFSVGMLRRVKTRIDDTVRTLSKNFHDYLSRGDLVNVKQLYGAYTMDTVIQVVFGTKVDSLVDQNNPLIQKAKQLFSNDMSIKNLAILSIMIMAPRLANTMGLKFNGDISEYFQRFAKQIIQQKRQEMAKGSMGKANNLLELMLEAEVEEDKLHVNGPNGYFDQYDNGGPKLNGFTDENSKVPKFLTTDEVVAQSVMFMIAGYDSTATSITMSSYCLALNPDAQEKLHQDIVQTISKLSQEAGPDGPKDPVELVTIESLSRFEYLTAVINETLRIYAPGSFTERVAGKDMTLETSDGRVRIDVKKGDVVHFPIYSMHRDEDQFHEPQLFKPERFMGEPTFHKYSYIPFGSGPRNCVAKSLALIEAKLALLHTVRQFKFSVAQETKVPPEFYYQSQIMVPKDIILRVEKR